MCAELTKLRRKNETQNAQLQRSDQIVRELTSQASDLQEALSAKDSQLGVLRVRFEEAEKQNQSNASVMNELRAQNDRYVYMCIVDHARTTSVFLSKYVQHIIIIDTAIADRDPYMYTA